MLRLDVWNLVFTIINLIILYLCMKKFLIGPVTAIMDKRAAMIQEQLTNASSSETKALEMKKQYEQVLASAEDESGKIVNQAKQDAKVEYEHIVESANKEAGKIIKEAQGTIEAQKDQAIREMQSQIAGLAMEAAEKVLGSKGGVSQDSMIYDQFLEEAGDAHDTDLN